MTTKIQEALAIAMDWGFYEGGHHKAWTIDQMVRVLAGDNYEQLIKEECDGEDGPNTYEWDEGIAP
jgi:hypothetical protein